MSYEIYHNDLVVDVTPAKHRSDLEIFEYNKTLGKSKLTLPVFCLTLLRKRSSHVSHRVGHGPWSPLGTAADRNSLFGTII